MPSAHAKLAPSSASRWARDDGCPGSVTLCASVVDTGSIFAETGTAGHEVFAACLSGEMKPAAFIGKKATNGIEITEELAEHVITALEFVDEFKEANPEASIFSEHKFEIGEGLGLPPGVLWGTSDFTAMTKKLLVVADLKLGFVDVDVESNEQLILYGLGAMDKTGWIYDRILLVILQPKKNLRPKEITYTREQMEGFAEEMKAGALKALDPAAPLVPSKDNCRFCKAAGVCPELKKEMLSLAKREFSSLVTLSGAEIGQILDQAKMIEGAVKAVRAHALRLLEIEPNHIPGWKRVKGEKRRRWKDKERAQVALETFGKTQGVPLELDDIAPRALTSPLQVETRLAAIYYEDRKKAGKKITKKAAMEAAQEALGTLIEKPEGEPTLVPEDDKREALGPVFSEAEIKEIEAGTRASDAVIEIKKEEMFD